MHIAMVTTYPPGTGSLNEYAFHFVRALRQKPEVRRLSLLTDTLPTGLSYPTFEDAPPTEIMPCWSFGAWDNPAHITRALARVQPDVVFFNLQFASFAASRVPAALGLCTPWWVKRRLGLPTAVLLHNLLDTVDLDSTGFQSTPLMNWLTRRAGEVVTRALLQADLVALTIPRYVDVLKDKYGAKNVSLTPHGSFDTVDMGEHVNGSHPPKPPGSPLRILAFGKFGTYKRLETLLEAYQDLLHRLQFPVELVIAGTDNPNARGYLAHIQRRYAWLPNVMYTGYVSEVDVPRIFQEADVVVFPYTSTTGSSGVLHQAGSYGCAVVLPAIGDFVDLMQIEGYVGELFQPGDPHSLADALQRVLSDPELRQEQGQQNAMAARGIPIADVVDWYLLHFERLLAT